MSGGSKKAIPDIPTEGTSLANPISYYKSRTGIYPSNSEVWWAYKRPLEIGSDKAPKTYLEVFDPSLRHQITTGNSQVAKGHYILDAFYQDRSSASGVSGLSVTSADANRPRAVAFFAGRVFYAGVNIRGYNTKVYFSQIIERPEQVQECYQALDPTSEDIRDLLPTDGGAITIPEMTEVYRLHPWGQALFVFARNGVWMITGSEGIGFRANDFSVSKVSGTPALSPLSFVTVEGAPLWWNRTGIYTLTLSQGGAQVQNLTEETIKSFYDDIPEESKHYAKGAYDPRLQRVQWVYRSTEADTDTDLFKYDSILNLDTRTGAFYPFDIADHGRIDVKGILDIEGYATTSTEENVTAGTVDYDELDLDVTPQYSNGNDHRHWDSFGQYAISNNYSTDDTETPAIYDLVTGVKTAASISTSNDNGGCHIDSFGNALFFTRTNVYVVDITTGTLTSTIPRSGGAVGSGEFGTSSAEYNADGTSHMVQVTHGSTEHRYSHWTNSGSGWSEISDSSTTTEWSGSDDSQSASIGPNYAYFMSADSERIARVSYPSLSESVISPGLGTLAICHYSEDLGTVIVIATDGTLREYNEDMSSVLRSTSLSKSLYQGALSKRGRIRENVLLLVDGSNHDVYELELTTLTIIKTHDNSMISEWTVETGPGSDDLYSVNSTMQGLYVPQHSHETRFWFLPKPTGVSELVVSDGEQVTIDVLSRDPVQSKFKYIVNVAEVLVPE